MYCNIEYLYYTKNFSRISSPQDVNSGNRKQNAFQSYPRIQNLRTTKHRPEEESSGREKLEPNTRVNVRINVTLRRFRATIFVVEKQ
jgi:hypothetical protein